MAKATRIDRAITELEREKAHRERITPDLLRFNRITLGEVKQQSEGLNDAIQILREIRITQQSMLFKDE